MAIYTSNNSEDTILDDNQPALNESGSAKFDVGEWKGGAQVLRSLIKWDFSSIPVGSTITSAILKIYDYGSDYADNTRTLRVYRVKRAWIENQATWNSYSTGNSWGTAGCSNTTSDREATDIGNVSIDATETAGEEYSITLDNTAITEMVNGSFTNNGFLLKMDTEDGDLHTFCSKLHATSGYRPTLTINYDLPIGGGYYFMSY